MLIKLMHSTVVPIIRAGLTNKQNKHVLRVSREGGHHRNFPLPDLPWTIWCKTANGADEPGSTKRGSHNK